MVSDNGRSFLASRREITPTFEANLRAARCRPDRLSTVTHGPAGRSNDSTRRRESLAKQPPAASIAELQAQLDRFIEHYNHHRPHRVLHGAHQPCVGHVTTSTSRRPPSHRYDHHRQKHHRVRQRPRAHRQLPSQRRRRIRRPNHHRAIAGIDCIIFWDNTLVRALCIDPTKFNQPSGRPTGGNMAADAAPLQLNPPTSCHDSPDELSSSLATTRNAERSERSHRPPKFGQPARLEAFRESRRR